MKTREPEHRHFGTSSLRIAVAVAGCAVMMLAIFSLAAGCGSGAVQTGTVSIVSEEDATTVTTPAYERQQAGYYLGVSEPRSNELAYMAHDASRLAEDHINTVSITPPVLITQRAGGLPRVILEGYAASTRSAIDDFHDAGLAVHLAPSTDYPGYHPQVESTRTNLEHLKEDTLKWAGTAEEKQVELFSPLERYNMALGTEAANSWSRDVLPGVRDAYNGELAASVVPDLDGPPAPGEPHDFEALDLSGYDYLLIDVFPRGEQFDSEVFQAYIEEILDRAEAVAARDGLKGIMVSFGGWREQVGIDTVDGPLLGNDGQASVASLVLQKALPRTSGVFFCGWTLPGRGARNFPVEDRLKELYGQVAGAPAP